MVIILTTGCKRDADSEVRKNLPGTWNLSRSDTDDFTSTVTVDRAGNYECRLVVHRQFATRTIDIGGGFEVRDGILIDTMTNSNGTTNLVSAAISRYGIVSASHDEFMFQDLAPDYIRGSRTNRLVWRREKK